MPEKVYDNGATLSTVLDNLSIFDYSSTKPMEKWNASGTRLLSTNRFQLMTRLSSYYVVEELCRAIDFQLAWHKDKRNQNMIFGMEDNSNCLKELPHLLSKNDLPPMDEERKVEEKSFLADSFFGSPRHLKRQSMNALTVVSEKGRQTFFITLTCNTHWPEIQERLFDGQSAFEREEIVCMVFKARLSAFLNNLR
jgi:hypothetical protein